MRLFAAAVVCLLAAPASAYDIKGLSQQDVLLIGEALDAMPHGKVSALYLRIQQQLTAENQATAEDAKAKAETDIRNKIISESKKDKPDE